MSPVQKMGINTVHKIWRWRPSLRMWGDQSFRWTFKMISWRVSDHAPIKIDQLTAINVIVNSAKNEDRHSPQNLKMTTFTKNVRRPIIPIDIKDDCMQSAQSRSDQNWSTYGNKCESDPCKNGGSTQSTNLKTTTLTKNMRRPIVPVDIEDDFNQCSRSRSDQNWSTYGHKCESHLCKKWGSTQSTKFEDDDPHKEYEETNCSSGHWRWFHARRTITLRSKLINLTAINAKVTRAKMRIDTVHKIWTRRLSLRMWGHVEVVKHIVTTKMKFMLWISIEEGYRCT